MTVEDKRYIAFTGGEVVSVDPENVMTTYEAMLVNGDKIVYLGDEAGLEDYLHGIREGGSDIDIVDISGRTILPGFTDSHLHASSTAELIIDADILLDQPGTLIDREEAIEGYRERMIEAVRKSGDASVVRGAGWDPGIFLATKEGLPTADDLAGICDEKPMILRSYDHHYAWVNKKALEVAKITAETPEPRNGRMSRDEAGAPSGVFQENTAVNMLLGRIPGSDYSIDEYKKGILAFQDRFAKPLGITMVFDAYNSENGMRAYNELAEEGKLTMRVKTCFYADPAGSADQFDRIMAGRDRYHMEDLFNVDSVKFFIDGTGLTFCMHEPFEAEWLRSIGMPGDYRGYPQWTQEELNEHFLRLSRHGFQIHVHCMGDRATTMAVDAFEYVYEKCGDFGRRHTIAHLMQVKDEDIARMGKLGIVAAMQPMWAQYASLADTMSSVNLGMKRVLDQYRIKSFMEAGSVVSFGTDFPVTIPPSPILGIQIAVSRSVTTDQPDYEKYRDRKLGPVDDPSRDCCSRAQAIGAYCYGGAYQCFMENITGTLEEGKSADFVVLSGTLSELSDNKLEKLEPEMTYFKGERIWEKQKV